MSVGPFSECFSYVEVLKIIDILYYILILANNLMNVYHEAVTFIRGRLCGAVVKRLTSVVEFRVRSFVGPDFTFSFFDIFFNYVTLWHQWSINFLLL